MTTAFAPRFRRRFGTLMPGDVPPPARLLRSEPDVDLDVPHHRFVRCGIVADRGDDEQFTRGDLGRGFDALTAEHVIPFYGRLAKCKTPGDRSSLAEDYPGLLWADGTYSEAGPSRYRVEALFLGGASYRDVAEVTGVDENFTWWYERVFFDISDKIAAGNRAWLADKVLVPAFYSGGRFLRENVLWKLISGICGWKLFSEGNDGLFQEIRGDIMEKLEVVMRQSVQTGALTASRTIQINRFTQLELVDQGHRGADVDLRKELARDSQGKEGDRLSTLLGAIFSNIQYTCAAHDAQPADVLQGPLAPDELPTDIYAKRERMNAERVVDQELGHVPLSDET